MVRYLFFWSNKLAKNEKCYGQTCFQGLEEIDMLRHCWQH